MNYTVCAGAINTMAPVIIPELVDSWGSRQYACSRLLGFCEDTTYRTIDQNVDINRLLDDKPRKIKDNNFLNKIYDEINADTKPRKTLQVL